MKINEINIGNIIYMDNITKYPMKVVNIDNYGDMSLDFEFNEGDVFDVNINDAGEIPVDDTLFDNNGFKFSYDIDEHNNVKIEHYEKIINDYTIRIDNKFKDDYKCTIYYKNNERGYFFFKYIHELQNGIMLMSKQYINFKL